MAVRLEVELQGSVLLGRVVGKKQAPLFYLTQNLRPDFGHTPKRDQKRRSLPACRREAMATALSSSRTNQRRLGASQGWFSTFGDGDDELLVRASAVLKSQGPENWPRGRPGLLRARKNPRSVRGASCGKTREEKTAGGVASRWRHRSGVLVVFFFVRKKRREGDLAQY